MGRVGALIRAQRARHTQTNTSKPIPTGIKRGQRSTTAAALIDLYREYFESLSPQQYANLNDSFSAHGKTEAGFVTAKELGPLLRALGDDPKPQELRDLISLVDADGNGLVDFTEFLTLVAVRSQHSQSEPEILAAFRMFDTDGSGTIPVKLFRSAMVQLCGLSDEEVDAMVVEAREVTRQHVARQRDVDNAKVARRELRRQRKLDSAAAGRPGISDVSHASPLVDSADVLKGGVASVIPSSSPELGTPPLRGRDALVESLRTGVSFMAESATPGDSDPEVIYYEPLVRILFSF